LPGMWTVEGLGVFANEQCTLSSALPLALIRRSDLGQWLRSAKARHQDAGRVDVDVKSAWRAIQAVAVTNPDTGAIEKHRHRVSNSPDYCARNT
jgi:hypothetical protein